jgi:hypothetical protein
MPRLLMLTTPSPLIARVYAPDHAVGVGGRNLRKDVLLVQFLLVAIQAQAGGFGGGHAGLFQGQQRKGDFVGY